MSEVKQNIVRLRDSIRESALRCGRNPEEIKAVLATKGVACERILEAYEAGCRDFAENRVQEWEEKRKKLPQDIRWHMIGHLQTNKVKDILGKIVLIHSLDRVELALEIQKQADKKGVSGVDCLLQINSSREETKYGLKVEEVEDLVETLRQPAIRLRGLMTIGPLTENREKVRQAFREVRLLRDRLHSGFPEMKLETLSMGMSGDYPLAIEEGATLLRIGSAVFGPRE